MQLYLKTAADIPALLKADCSADGITAALLKEYDVSEEQIRASVEKMIGVLRRERLLTE